MNKPRTIWAIVGIPELGYMYAKELIVCGEDNVNYAVAFGSSAEIINKASAYSSEEEAKQEIDRRLKSYGISPSKN